MVDIKIKRDEGAYMPTREHPTDAGYDLRSREDALVWAGTSRSFDTGVHFEIPEGYCGLVASKSGLMKNKEMTSRGLIDSCYRGSVHVVLFNHGKEAVEIRKGQKISQIVFTEALTANLIEVDELSDTDRGENGFGSTGEM